MTFHALTSNRFFSDAATGSLPALTWIAPRQGVNVSLGKLGGPNSDHPNCCDVALGERLRKDIYEALRAGPGWNRTAFIMTWDDPGALRSSIMTLAALHPVCPRQHSRNGLPLANPCTRPPSAAHPILAPLCACIAGGWYDHVPPPMSAPAPDDQEPCYCGGGSPGDGGSSNGRAPTCLGPPKGSPPNPYTRLGSRLPVVLVSPWVQKGTVEGRAKGPQPDSQYDGTSIIATVKKLFNLPKFLTRRDAWAGTFEHLFEALDEPRGDAPMPLPDAPEPSPARGPHPWGGDCDDPTRRMRRSISELESLLGAEAPPRLHACANRAPVWATTCEPGTMHEASVWLANATERWRRSGSSGRQTTP